MGGLWRRGVGGGAAAADGVALFEKLLAEVCDWTGDF